MCPRDSFTEKGANEPRPGKDDIVNHACPGKSPLGQREEQSQKTRSTSVPDVFEKHGDSQVLLSRVSKRENRRHRESGRNKSTDALGSWKEFGFFL